MNTTTPTIAEKKIIAPDVPPTVKENGRAKSTLNLKTFGTTPEEDAKVEVVVIDKSSDKPLQEEELKKAWLDFAELRKHQIAEYNLLKKEFSLSGVVVTIMLSNPIEQPLLQNLRVQLIAHLRGKLNNNSITVVGILQEQPEGKKIAYTAKEKFDHLAEKNPALQELRDRFGLDPDF